MKDYSYYIYENIAFNIGELNNNNKICGLGYTYYLDEGSFLMGHIWNDDPKGWCCSGDQDYISIESDSKANSIKLIANSDSIIISHKINSNANGLNFTVHSDRTWIVSNDNLPGNRCVFYDGKNKKLLLCIEGLKRMEWSAQIGAKNITTDFTMKAKQPESPSYKNLPDDFSEYDNEVSSEDGPIIYYDHSLDETRIGTVVPGKKDEWYWDGTRVWDNKQEFGLDSLQKDEMHGSAVVFIKKTKDFILNYWDNGKLDNVRTFGHFLSKKCIEIKNFAYGDKHLYDSLLIDEYMNVTYFKKYNYDNDTCESSIYYDFDEIYDKNSD